MQQVIHFFYSCASAIAKDNNVLTIYPHLYILRIYSVYSSSCSSSNMPFQIATVLHVHLKWCFTRGCNTSLFKCSPPPPLPRISKHEKHLVPHCGFYLWKIKSFKKLFTNFCCDVLGSSYCWIILSARNLCRLFYYLLAECDDCIIEILDLCFLIVVWSKHSKSKSFLQ